MKIFNRLLSALLVLCMVASAFTTVGLVITDSTGHVHADETETPEVSGTPSTEEEEELVGASVIRKDKFKTDEEKLATMMKVAADGTKKPYISAYGYELYANEKTGEVAIKNTVTGQTLFSNPYDANQYVSSAASSSSTATVWESIVSQISIEYTDNKGAAKTLCSFKDAAEQDQINITHVKNGISVNYTIGRSDARRICPMRTTRAFMEEQILALIEDTNDKKRLYPQLYVLYDSLSGKQPQSVVDSWIERIPELARMELYVLNETTTNQEKNRIEGILKAWCPKISYEQIDEQHNITGYVASNAVLPCFRMSLIYKLDEGGVTVKLPANSIVFNEDYYTLKTVTVLPYLGAGNAANNGFTFLPDGTGAVVEFKDIETSSVILTGSMYGADYAYHTLPTSFTGKSEIMRFPAFGVVEEKVITEKFFLDENGNKTDKPYCVHVYEDVVTAPTCTEAGYTTSTCKNCKQVITRFPTDPAHTYDEKVEGSIVVEPTTCQKIGKTTYTCTVCKDVKVVEDTEIGTHDYVATPKAGEVGIVVYTCSTCNDTYEVGHNEHNLSSIGSLDPVCSEGKYDIRANAFIYKDGVLKLYVPDTHILKFIEGAEIVLSDGSTGTIASVSYEKIKKNDLKELIKAEGGVDGVATNEAYRYEVIINVNIADYDALIGTTKTFNFTLDKVVGNGYTLSKCLDCGFTVKTKISSSVHNYASDTKAEGYKQATCTEEGVNVLVCKDCKDTITKPIAKTAHSLPSSGKPSGKWASLSTGDIIDDSKLNMIPESQRVQLTEYECTKCKEKVLKTDTCKKDALGNDTHVYTNFEVTTPGNCTTYSVSKRVCKLCQTVETKTATEYKHNYETVVVDATCTERGYTDFTCKDCGYSYRGEYVEAHHKFEETVTDFTCTTGGYTDYKCTACGYEERGAYTDAAHKYESVVTAPTCTTKGFTTNTCTVCGNVEITDEIEPKHELSRYIITKDATITEDGLRHRICVLCDYREPDEVVPALGTGGLDYYEKVTIAPNGYIAIITEGETLSTITSSHGGALHPYNSTYITINPRPSDTYNLADALSVGSDEPWTVVSERKYTGNYSLRIVLVSDNEGSKYGANVSGMAAAYRDYLKSSGQLTALEQTDKDIPLYIEALGATEVQTTILSFPVYKMTALTTFDDLNTMISDLAKYNVTNLNFRLTGFVNGGMKPTIYNKAEFEDVVGGNDGYSEFAENANKNGIGVFTEFDFAYLHNTSLFDGYSDSKHALETIDGRYIVKKEYNPTYQMFKPTNLLAISPSVFKQFYDKLSVSLGKLGYYGISASTLGTDLNSDFNTDNPHNREDVKGYVQKVLERMKQDSGGNVMIDGGNAYTYAYVNHILNMATSSSNYLDSSASIPFISMVLHGYISYAGAPTNNASNINYEILKMIETGSNPYFLLCAQNTSALKEDANLSKYYSIAYNIWMKNENTTDEFNIVDIYNRINEVMSKVQYADYVKFEHLIGEREITAGEREEVDAANAEKLAELKKKMEDAEKVFQSTVELYERLLREGVENVDVYFDNITTRRSERNAAVKAYNDFVAKLSAKPGYLEDGSYAYTDYTVDDKSIVYVEYANGIAFILNYNNFDVTINKDGKEIKVGAMNYELIDTTKN